MKFFFLVTLLLLPLLGLAQEGGSPEEVHVDSEDEKALQELEANREQRQKVLNSLQKAGDEPEIKATLDPKEQLDKLGFQGPVNPALLFNEDALKSMEILIRQAKLWDVPAEEVRKQVVQAFKGNPLEGFVNDSPNLQSFMVDFVRDKEAILNSIAIFKDRSRLKMYLYIWIGIMFASYYTKRLFVSKYWKKPVKIIASLMFTLMITIISASTFTLIFENEMKPIIAVVKKHL